MSERDFEADLLLCEEADLRPWRWCQFKAFNGAKFIVEGNGEDFRVIAEVHLSFKGCEFMAASSVGWKAALLEVRRLSDAIRRHRDERGNDRCWMDDETLYKALPEGYTPPEREVEAELAECQKFLACRRNPGTEYISSQREIELLKSDVQFYLELMTEHRNNAIESRERAEAAELRFLVKEATVENDSHHCP